jgi:dTDP-4-amino-4,6-dideoxygalactose transaminase
MSEDTLHVGRPNVGDRDAFLRRVNDMLDARWFSNDGPLVREFENRIRELVGVEHCVAMCNATVALEIAVKALELSGEVIVPSFTFVATAHALQWQGITPVFGDIDRTTHNLDPNQIEELITPRTTGIIGVHLWGRPCNTEGLEQVAKKHNLTLIYDAAHAFGCSAGRKMVGGFGSCEVFSFHATKFMNSFEGGAVVTNDSKLADKLRLMRNFGFKGYDRVDYLGVNGKMTEVCAAMGLTSMDAMDEFVDVNRRNYEAYGRCLEGMEGVSLIQYNQKARNNYQYIVVEIDETKTHVSRDSLIARFHDEGVIARKYFWPGCHRMEPYRTSQPNAGQHLPVTEDVSDRVIVLPTGQTVHVGTIERVCGILRTSLA